MSEPTTEQNSEDKSGCTSALNSAFWWALNLAVAYAEDEGFSLCETVEWSQMHVAAGLSAKATNEEIGGTAHKQLSVLGWTWSAFTPVGWQYKPNSALCDSDGRKEIK